MRRLSLRFKELGRTGRISSLFGLFRGRGRSALAVDDFSLVRKLDRERSQAEEHDMTGVGASSAEQRVGSVKTIQHTQHAKILVEFEVVEVVGFR